MMKRSWCETPLFLDTHYQVTQYRVTLHHVTQYHVTPFRGTGNLLSCA